MRSVKSIDLDAAAAAAAVHNALDANKHRNSRRLPTTVHSVRPIALNFHSISVNFCPCGPPVDVDDGEASLSVFPLFGNNRPRIEDLRCKSQQPVHLYRLTVSRVQLGRIALVRLVVDWLRSRCTTSCGILWSVADLL